ncbi:MAG: D-2-hydroxyacid dehydrogenase [Opitutae bacterium]|nr:D-2-hydroxyacid dehydrogenase [Opitutae bacterium]
MKIVVLDGRTLNPEDLSWDELAKFGELKIHERTPPELVTERCAGAEVIITNKALVTRETLTKLPDLRYVGVTATGYNVVDLPYCLEKGITVTNVPSYSTNSVAQAVFAHVLRFTHRVEEHANSVRDGQWNSHPDFSYCIEAIDELDGQNLGIFGYGEIGQAVARLGRAFGMSILIHSRSFGEDDPAHGKALQVDELFAQSDVLTLHCPLTPETENCVNAERLKLMKNTAFLINTARGPLVDEHTLAEALESGMIAGAGLDVLSSEPPSPENPLLQARNCFITPHYAWATLSARKRLMKETVSNLRSFLEGKPRNVVGA